METVVCFFRAGALARTALEPRVDGPLNAKVYYITMPTEMKWSITPALPEDCSSTEEYAGARIVFSGEFAVVSFDIHPPNDRERIEYDDFVRSHVNALSVVEAVAFRTRLSEITAIDPETGGRSVTAFLEGICAGTSSGLANMIATDQNGNVVFDSKSVARKNTRDLAEAVMKSPALRFMCDAFGRFNSDEGKDFGPLYDVLERAKCAMRLKGLKEIGKPLGVTEALEEVLGIMNNASILNSRHRGNTVAAQRPATRAEIAKVAALVKNVVENFGQLVRDGVVTE